MARIGLDFGEKVVIQDKNYLSITEGMDMASVLGRMTYRKFERPVSFTEEDTTKQPDRFGNYPEMPTGEVKWSDILVLSEAQGESIFVSLINWLPSQVEALDLKLGDEVELVDPILTYSRIGREDIYKIFATGLKKVNKNQGQNQNKENKDQK